MTRTRSPRRRALGRHGSAAAFLARSLRGLLAVAALGALVVGVPWALAHFVGWPLPDHLPSRDEVQGTVMGPLGPDLLLDLLACLCWVAWAAFTLDLVLCVVEAARRLTLPDISSARPTRAVAAVLVTAVLVAVLGNRVLADTAGSVAATAGPAPGATPQIVVAGQHWSEQADQRVALLAAAGKAARPRSVVVRAPLGGVHDSLWRIAERTLGDGRRWPEIFELNRGMRQPPGTVFTRPSLIYPGQELALPPEGGAGQRAEPQGTVRAQLPPPPPLSSAGSMAGRDRPATAAEGRSQLDGAIVGGFVAAALGAVLLAARRRSRRRYRPGSGSRDDLASPPIVRRLEFDHLRDIDNEYDAETDDIDRRVDREVEIEVAPSTIPRKIPPPPVRRRSAGGGDGRDIALALASLRGLGLVGEGAPAALRALLVAILLNPERRGQGPTVVVPEGSLRNIVSLELRPDALPPAVQVTAELGTALDLIEKETLRRSAHPDVDGSTWPPVALVTTAPADDGRLQAVLDDGAQVGIVGLLLGQWVPGVTAYVRQDGTISATSPGPGEDLRGRQLFRLDDRETADLFDLLRAADRAPAVERPSDDVDLEITATPGAPPVGRYETGSGTSAEWDEGRPDVREDAGFTGDPDTCPAQPRPVEITVFGPPSVCLHDSEPGAEPRDITAQLQPRTRELLVFLALHPAGATREGLAAAMWPASSVDRISNALNTALTRLRRSVEEATGGTLSEIVLTGEGRFRLDGDLVSTDFDPFDAALHARRLAATAAERLCADQSIVDAYGGTLADGMSSDWTETAREGIRRDALDAVASLARALVEDDPQRTLDLLEVARAFDPHNEAVYRDIMRLQTRLGMSDAVPRTLALLATRLAELDDIPSPQVVDLASRLADGATGRAVPLGTESS